VKADSLQYPRRRVAVSQGDSSGEAEARPEDRGAGTLVVSPDARPDRPELARRTDETGVPEALRDALDAFDDETGLDYEDLGHTEISEERSLAELDEIETTRPDDRVTDQGEPCGEELLEVAMYEPLRRGDVVASRYRIERQLGHGATGMVYEAHDAEAQRPVALKVLFPYVAVQPTALQRLFREARIAATVRHPNVVQVFEAARDGEHCFLAMELLEGRPLSALMQERGPLPLATVGALFDPILDGIAAVHDEGVVHRDIKPDNIFLHGAASAASGVAAEGLGVPKVLDFGVSKVKTSSGGQSKLTQLGTVMGTPYYMAPEQLADTSSVGVRADVYSLGVMLYEAVSGRLPYRGEGVVEIFTAASAGSAPSVDELRADCPPALAAVIRRAMHPDEAQRFDDVHALRQALREALESGTASATSQPGATPEAHDANAWAGARRDGPSAPLPLERTHVMASGPSSGQALGAAPPTPIASPRLDPAPAPAPYSIDPARLVLYLAAAAASGGLFVALLAVVLYLVFG
jgi:eukaryotic-like serine/threonine-protein kinase